MKRDDNKKTIVFYPHNYDKRNPYTDIIKSLHNELGFKIVGIKDIKSCLFKRLSFVNLNWYENIPDKTYVRIYLRYYLRIITILYLKHIKRAKVIFTLHNKCSHEEKNRDFSRNLIRWLCKISDIIVIMCDESKRYLIEQQFIDKHVAEKKCVKIPHISYSDIYKTEDHKERQFEIFREEGKFNILYFGFIRPYKNIEVLIQSMNYLDDCDICLSIIGQGDDSYIDTLQTYTNTLGSIKIIDTFVPDDMMFSMIRQSDIVVLPYNIDSVLNSGAAILAVSAGRNVVCSEIGTMLEFPREFSYLYSYRTLDDQCKELAYKIKEAYTEFKDNRSSFLEKQKKMCEYLSENNSKKRILEMYRMLYNNLEISYENQ